MSAHLSPNSSPILSIFGTTTTAPNISFQTHLDTFFLPHLVHSSLHYITYSNLFLSFILNLSMSQHTFHNSRYLIPIRHTAFQSHPPSHVVPRCLKSLSLFNISLFILTSILLTIPPLRRLIFSDVLNYIRFEFPPLIHSPNSFKSVSSSAALPQQTTTNSPVISLPFRPAFVCPYKRF